MLCSVAVRALRRLTSASAFWLPPAMAVQNKGAISLLLDFRRYVSGGARHGRQLGAQERVPVAEGRPGERAMRDPVAKGIHHMPDKPNGAAAARPVLYPVTQVARETSASVR